MTNETIKPSVIASLYEVFNALEKKGLTRKQIYLLIQEKGGKNGQRHKLSIDTIRATVNAMIDLEKQLLSAGWLNTTIGATQ